MKIEVDILELLLPNLLTLVTQLCATFLLFILLKKLAWNPVRKILETRAAYEQGKLEEADRKNAEAEELRKEAEDNISKAQAEARQIVEDSRVEGEKAKEKLLEEAREETEQMTKQAKEKLALERAEMEKEVQKEIVDVALLAAEKLLNEKVDEKKDREYIENFLKEN